MTERDFIRRSLVVLGLAALFFLAWQLRGVLLLLFGAVLVGVIFRSLAAPIRRVSGALDKVAVAIAVLIILAFLGISGWLFGGEVRSQVSSLAQTVPQAWQSFELRIGGTDLGQRIRSMVGDAASGGSGLLSSVGGTIMSIGTGIADALVVIVGGIYLAMQPKLYRGGALKLVPARRREQLSSAIDDSGSALRQWLGGQLVSMTVIGILTGSGLWLLDMPSALALGLLAGLLEFIPLVGPVIAAVPALLLALAVDPQLALWVLGLYIAIQQIEGNVVQPIVQQYAVDLPAVVLLFAILAFGALFGMVGIILAAPLAVVLYVFITRLYVRDGLDTKVSVPGEDEVA